MKNNCNLSPKVIKYLEEMAIEREISNQIRASAERDWYKREGHKLFGNFKTIAEGVHDVDRKKFWRSSLLASLTRYCRRGWRVISRPPKIGARYSWKRGRAPIRKD